MLFNRMTTEDNQGVGSDVNFDQFSRFYDTDYRNYIDDLEMIIEVAHMAGEQALELGCGTGRVLVPLAAAGRLVTGVDGSKALLDIAEGKARDASVSARVQLVHDDLRTFRLQESDYDFAYCVSNTLMHLTSQDDQLAVLMQAHHHLRVGGVVLLDLFSPDIVQLTRISGLKELADRWVDDETGTQVYKWVVREVDVAQQLQDTLFIYEEIHADGRVEKTAVPFTLRFLWPSEAELLLRMAGFEVEACYGDFDGSSYTDQSERLIFVARKVAEPLVDAGV